MLTANSIPSLEKNSSQGAYEDNVNVMDCKEPIFKVAERTVYNIAGEILFHFKYGEAESLDMSNGQTINPGAIIASGRNMACDEKLRTFVLSRHQFDTMQLSYLANSPKGDGTVFNGPLNPTSDSTYPVEARFVIRFNENHELAELFPGQNVRGLPSSYRSLDEIIQLNCVEKSYGYPFWDITTNTRI